MGSNRAPRKQYFRIGTGEKGNLSPPAEHAEWRRFISVELPNGDNVGVVRTWNKPGIFDGVEKADILKIQMKIKLGEWWADPQSKVGWAGEAVADILGLDVTDKGVRRRVNEMLKVWMKDNDKGFFRSSCVMMKRRGKVGRL